MKRKTSLIALILVFSLLANIGYLATIQPANASTILYKTAKQLETASTLDAYNSTYQDIKIETFLVNNESATAGFKVYLCNATGAGLNGIGVQIYETTSYTRVYWVIIDAGSITKTITQEITPAGDALENCTILIKVRGTEANLYVNDEIVMPPSTLNFIYPIYLYISATDHVGDFSSGYVKFTYGASATSSLSAILPAIIVITLISVLIVPTATVAKKRKR